MKTNNETRMKYFLYFVLVIPAVLSISGCSSHRPGDAELNHLAYHVDGQSLLARNTPTFVVERPEDDWNRIATPIVMEHDRKQKVALDSDTATVYAEIRHWQGRKDSYTNLIYRVHFTEVPFSLIPFHLTAGKNVGLLVIITLNSANLPVMLTTVHTCGCYLAFIPTSHLDRSSWPEGWHPEKQKVYGESLPGLLKTDLVSDDLPLMLLIRESTHRIKDIRLLSGEDDMGNQPTQRTQLARLAPLESLSRIDNADGTVFSFYETEGRRKDYVVDSQKIWERLFISWWALDWRVGEDKRLGEDTTDGIIFYTSLKPWARSESDLRDFSQFLNYWGWDL